MENIFKVEVNYGLENGFNCSCYAFCSRYFIMGRNYNGKGGEYNKKNSNKIMRYRIVFQAAALFIFLGLLLIRD